MSDQEILKQRDLLDAILASRTNQYERIQSMEVMDSIYFKEKLPDPSLAISNEPGMRLKGETPKSPRGKEIVRKAAEKFGSYAKPISKVALRAIGPFIPIAGTAATAIGVADVAEAAEQGLRDESLGIAYLLGPEKAKQYSEFKGRIKGNEDDTEAFVP